MVAAWLEMARCRRQWRLRLIIHRFRKAALDGIPISRKPVRVIGQNGANAASARWLEESAVGECLQNNTDIVCAGRVVHFPDGSINERACWWPSLQEFNSIATLEERASYLGHFFLLRRQTVLDAGGLDESIGNYPGIDDFDLLWTLLERNATVSFVTKGLYHYRDHHGDRLTLQNPDLAVANLKKILRKHGIAAEQAVDIVKRHARWYGKPQYQVMNES
jgi:hypothetical protein